MRLNNTFILFDAGDISKTDDWKKAHTAIDTAVQGMSWPPGTKAGMILPRIVSIKQGGAYIDKAGKPQIWDKAKPLTLRNGVVPLKDMFRARLETAGWKTEAPLSLKPYFEKIRADKNLAQVFRYPEPTPDAIHDPLHEGVGDFDFWLRSPTIFAGPSGSLLLRHTGLLLLRP